MPVEPDQPTALVNYNTDQFTDPVTGATVHDDGSDFYLCRANGVIYFKQRRMSGQWYSRTGDYVSYQITLIPPAPDIGVGLVTPDGHSAYIDQNGFWYIISAASITQFGLVTPDNLNAIADQNNNWVVIVP